jgi:hypothetical protein
MKMNYERIGLWARDIVSDRSIKEITGKVRRVTNAQKIATIAKVSRDCISMIIPQLSICIFQLIYAKRF